MKPNNHQNINPELSQYSAHELETPIDAEIIAEVEFKPSQMDQTEATIINLTLYPSTEDYEEPNESLDPFPQWLKQGLISLSSPWGVGSLSLVLGANLAIIGVQLWTIYQTPEPQASTKINSDPSSLSLSIPKSLNLARKSPNTVILDALSTVPTPKPSQPSLQKVVKAAPPSQTRRQTVVHVNQLPSLTNAILPPSLQPQPQTPTNYGMAITPLKVPQTPKAKKTPQPSIPLANIPRPVASMTITPPPQTVSLEPQQQQISQTEQNADEKLMTLPAINQESLSQDEQIRQTIKQQLQMEENNQSNIPLGFNHTTRLELQNGLNQVSPELLPQQTKYLEQLQEREVLDANE